MSEKKVETGRNTGSRWHLSEGNAERGATEAEFALMRAFEGFGRWQSECLASVSDLAATGSENALLHIIRMNDRPKSVRDLARLTNRDDVPNIQYSLRKLIGAGLVLRRGSGRSGVTYEVTEEGRRVTEAFRDLRRELLITAIGEQPGLGARLAEATRTLNALTAVYEEAARAVAIRRR